MYKNRQHPTEAGCRLFCCPILLSRCRFCSFLRLLSYRHTGNSVFLFEAPIDMLSYITMNPNGWQQNTYAASCSVADRVLFQCLKDNPNLTDVYLCFDSDTAGQSAAKRISDKLFTQGYKSEILVPTKKDWNEDLIMQKEGEQAWTEQSY